VFVANAHYVFGNLRTWGWSTLILGALQLLAAAGVVAGNQLARWFGVAVLGLNAIDQNVLPPRLPEASSRGLIATTVGIGVTVLRTPQRMACSGMAAWLGSWPPGPLGGRVWRVS